MDQPKFIWVTFDEYCQMRADGARRMVQRLLDQLAVIEPRDDMSIKADQAKAGGA